MGTERLLVLLVVSRVLSTVAKTKPKDIERNRWTHNWAEGRTLNHRNRNKCFKTFLNHNLHFKVYNLMFQGYKTI